jgi:hypothetical protein
VEHDRVDVAGARERGSAGVHRLERSQHHVALLVVGEPVLAVAAVGGRRAELVGDQPGALGPECRIHLREGVAERPGVEPLGVGVEAQAVGSRDRAVACE